MAPRTSDSIVAKNEAHAKQVPCGGGFGRRGMCANASTRFTAAANSAMGAAEIGISTDKIGARGPDGGLDELTSYKWLGIVTDRASPKNNFLIMAEACVLIGNVVRSFVLTDEIEMFFCEQGSFDENTLQQKIQREIALRAELSIRVGSAEIYPLSQLIDNATR